LKKIFKPQPLTRTEKKAAELDRWNQASAVKSMRLKSLA
jgi:hypothetical protein